MKVFLCRALALCLLVSFEITGCGGGGSSSNSGSGGSGGNNNPAAPAITSISPTSAPAGSAALTLTVTGTGFTSSSVVSVGGSAEATTFVSSTGLTAAVPASQLTSGGELAVAVATGSLKSTPINLEVDNPAPTIASVSPASVVPGVASQIVTVTGTGFVSSTVINVNGSARPTAFTSATQVAVTLTAADVAGSGSLSLTAVNPSPGGGTSSAATVAIANPVPGPIQLSPSSLLVGSTTPATVTVTGTGFISTSVVSVNGSPRATTYAGPTTVTFVATVADQSSLGTLAVTVTNPAPGGGTSPSAKLTITVSPTPYISSVSPNTIYAGAADTSITVSGTGFAANSVVQWNGTALSTALLNVYGSGYELTATVPAADLKAAGTASVTVNTSTANPPVSNAVAVSITNPPAPTLTSISPEAGPINTSENVTVFGTGFTQSTSIALNGATIPTTFVDSTELTGTIPPASVALLGNASVTVTTPAPGGGTSAVLAYTVYLQMPNSDIVFNPTDGLLYVSVPTSGAGVSGNSVAGIDPATGNVIRQFWVGSNPNKLALSTDHTQLFVGLDGAGAVAQVDLTQGKVVNQFGLGGGPGVYNPPYTAAALAAVPGSPNSVAVLSIDGVVSIYDSGVARPNNSSGMIDSYFDQNYGSLAFGSSSSTLFANFAPFQGLEVFTVDSTGITAGNSFTASGSNSAGSSIQYDNGRLYVSNGSVFDATSGNELGTFYSSASSPAAGPVVSDSTLGKAFIAGDIDYVLRRNSGV